MSVVPSYFLKMLNKESTSKNPLRILCTYLLSLNFKNNFLSINILLHSTRNALIMFPTWAVAALLIQCLQPQQNIFQSNLKIKRGLAYFGVKY